jgi:hypothetical protein
MEAAQDQSQSIGMLPLDPDRDSAQEKALQTLVSEAKYCHANIVTRNVSGYNRLKPFCCRAARI